MKSEKAFVTPKKSNLTEQLKIDLFFAEIERRRRKLSPSLFTKRKKK